MSHDMNRQHHFRAPVINGFYQIYACIEGVETIGWDLAEYVNSWHNLSTEERQALARQLSRI
jgi:hypothetical protein